jgi:hypothetical protein
MFAQSIQENPPPCPEHENARSKPDEGCSTLEQSGCENPSEFPEHDGMKSKLLNDENRPAGGKIRLCNHYTRREFFTVKLLAMNDERPNDLAAEAAGRSENEGAQILGFRIPCGYRTKRGCNSASVGGDARGQKHEK